MKERRRKPDGSIDETRRPSRTRLLPRAVAVAVVGILALFIVAPPASAHGGDETQEGYLLVQQALGYLANEPETGVDLAMEKVDAVLAAADQEGVDIAAVKQAKTAIEAGQVDQARQLLQGSIAEALKMLPPAIGEQTGTTVVTAELVGGSDLAGRDAGFLVVSVILFVVGVWLAFRFRPTDNIGDLRRQLTASHLGPATASGDLSTVEGES
jgi:hypothetical protein